MEFFLIVLIMLAVIGLSNIINHIVPSVPVPLVQAALGVLIAIAPGGFNIPMEPDLFFVLFIAPILFNDGKNVSRRAMWNLRKQILFLVLGLVLITVLVIGYLTHWLVPSIPLSAAFALAAILSPTDIVAVNAMAGRVRIPKNVMHLLEGEGLMNDASGLVAFNFAVAATVTGAFSLMDAGLSFLVIAVGGFAGGALLAFLIIGLKKFIRRMGMEDVTFHMLIQILTPFVIFLIIEHLHLSGILAVVAAGIVHAMVNERDTSPSIDLQVASKSTWNVLLYILNGLVFILLGLQIPDIMDEIFKDPNFNNMRVIGYTLIISASLFVLRFIWMYLLEWRQWKLKGEDSARPGFRMTAIATISGVRGSVTLAGAFSIPFMVADGSLFPERSLLIFIAAGVILVTLVTASILLPMITKPKSEEAEDSGDDMKRALGQTYRAAIHAVKGAANDENREVAMGIISGYNRGLRQLKADEKGADAYALKKMETEVRMKALEAESQYITKLLSEKCIGNEEASLAQAHIHRMEVAVTNGLKFRVLMILALLKRIVYLGVKILMPRKYEALRKQNGEKMIIMGKLRKDMSNKAIQAIESGMTPDNRDISYLVIGEYVELYKRIKAGRSENRLPAPEGSERELKEKAFQAERDEIQKLYETGKISKDITKKIRQQINIREAYFMEEE